MITPDPELCCRDATPVSPLSSSSTARYPTATTFTTDGFTFRAKALNSPLNRPKSPVPAPVCAHNGVKTAQINTNPRLFTRNLPWLLF